MARTNFYAVNRQVQQPTYTSKNVRSGTSTLCETSFALLTLFFLIVCALPGMATYCIEHDSPSRRLHRHKEFGPFTASHPIA